jgi:hypothetical protein
MWNKKSYSSKGSSVPLVNGCIEVGGNSERMMLLPHKHLLLLPHHHLMYLLPHISILMMMLPRRRQDNQKEMCTS